VINAGVARYRKLNSRHLAPVKAGISDGTMYLDVETTQSRVRVAMAARTVVRLNGEEVETHLTETEEPGFVAQTLEFGVTEGIPTTVDKTVTLFTSRDHAISEPGRAARAWIWRLGSFDELLESNTLAWDLLWRRFSLDTGADDFEAMVLNLHSFHLMQTVSKHTIDLDVGVPAPAIAVAVLIIVLSVVNGFERELRERVFGVLPHLAVYGRPALTEDAHDLERLQALTLTFDHFHLDHHGIARTEVRQGFAHLFCFCRMLNNKLNRSCNLFRIKRVNTYSTLCPFNNLLPEWKIRSNNRNSG